MSDEWDISVLFLHTLGNVLDDRYHKAPTKEMNHAVQDCLFQFHLKKERRKKKKKKIFLQIQVLE